MVRQTVNALVESIVLSLGSNSEEKCGHEGDDVFFALFNGPNSICSQKCRAVFAQHDLRYTSYSMNMFAGQTYIPDYVRLRMIGCEAAGMPLVTRHTGSSSVAHTGCDPAVVPTLVDLRTDSVVVDSHRICRHVDDFLPEGSRLVPPGLEEEITKELDIIDQLPNYQMLVGRPPGEDTRPDSRRHDDGTALAMSKVNRCDEYLEVHADDAELVTAYSAKRGKEYSAATDLFQMDQMKTVYETAQKQIDALEERLGQSPANLLFGPRPTLADIFWGVELLRMDNIGARGLWNDGRHPKVTGYLKVLSALPSLRSAVLDWPGSQF